VELIPLDALRIKHKKKLLAIGNALVPMTEGGEFDPAAVLAKHGSWQAYGHPVRGGDRADRHRLVV
jgi:hypothetical protein